MNNKESQEYVRTKFYLGTNTVEANIKEEIDYLIGDYRFGFARLTGMSKISQTRLQALEKLVIVPRKDLNESSPRRRLTSVSTRRKKGSSQLTRVAIDFLAKPCCKRELVSDRTPTNFFEDSKKETPELRPFVEVNWHFTDSQDEISEQIPATILEIFDDGYADIALYGEWALEFDYTPVIPVPLNELTPRIQPVEGLQVRGNYLGEGNWFEGKIHRVRPSGRINVLYDDGDFEEEIDLDRYVVE